MVLMVGGRVVDMLRPLEHRRFHTLLTSSLQVLPMVYGQVKTFRV
jgi:hypothetical protein